MTQPPRTHPSTLQTSQNRTTENKSSEDTTSQIDVKQLIELLSRDLQQVEHQLETVGTYVSSPLTRNIAEAADELREAITDFLDKTRTEANALATQAKEKSQALHEQMEKHPVAAASSAFALGYFLGRTVFRHKPHETDS